MKSKENEYKVMFEGHKHERSHWVWCGFACLTCHYQDVPNPGSCVKDEVMDREMNKQPIGKYFYYFYHFFLKSV
jgi:hypothetical protein